MTFLALLNQGMREEKMRDWGENDFWAFDWELEHLQISDNELVI